MKKIFRTIFVVLSATALISCSGEKERLDAEPAMIRATVSISGDALTRATGIDTSQEENVNNLQLFVFNESGGREYYVSINNSRSGEIVVEEGKKTIVAVVNAPDLKDISSRTALMGQTSRLSENSLTSMVMTGEVEALIQDSKEITITVTRLISKVTVKKISTAFKSSVLASQEFKINSIYLINVAGDNKYSGTAEPTMWYNKLYKGSNDSATGGSFALLSDPVGRTVANQSSYSVEHSFYCYPNPTVAESFESTWCPRHTMLVVDATLGGKQTYYPVELPVIGRNKHFLFEEIIITRMGSDEPYIPVPDGACGITVQVENWDVILMNTETI